MFKFKPSKHSTVGTSFPASGPPSLESSARNECNQALKSNASIPITNFNFKFQSGQVNVMSPISHSVGQPQDSATPKPPNQSTSSEPPAKKRKQGHPPGTGHLQKKAAELVKIQAEQAQTEQEDHTNANSKMRRLDSGQLVDGISSDAMTIDSPLPKLTPGHPESHITIDLGSAPSETFPGKSRMLADRDSPTPLAFDDDEDRDIGLACDGLGVEDEEEDDDSENVNCTGIGSHNAHSHAKRSALPDWLREAFNEYVLLLNHCGPDGLPPLYRDNKTFYFPRHSSYFILRDAPFSEYPNPAQFWDQSILELLPKALAAEFPAHLSHRSGILHGLFMFMHSCFQHGLGAKQFADALRAQQLQRYDELQLQYSHFLLNSSTLKLALTGKKAELFPPFDDRSEKGFAGFVPGHQWLRDLYDSFIESHLQDFNQHTAMLTGEICAIDHSFKVTKQIVKINGIQVFVALLTVTNEKGEIRLCNLVASKSHLQFELALVRMQESLKIYGHASPLIFYTDNMADKEFLENAFPSLREDLVPIENLRWIELYPIAHQVTKQIVKINGIQVFVALLTVTNEKGEIRLCNLVASKSHLQFELALVRMQESLKIYGHASPLIFYTDNMADKEFLENAFPSLREDLVPIEKYSNLDPLIIPEGEVTVSSPLRTASDIDSRMQAVIQLLPDDDSDTQVVVSFDAEYNVEVSSQDMSLVMVIQQLSRLLAVKISLFFSNEPLFDGIHLTPTRCVIKVTDVYVPGAIISPHKKQLLSTFGSPPFHLVCLHSRIHVSSEPPLAFTPSSTSHTLASNMVSTTSDPASSYEPVDDGDATAVGIGMLMLDTADSPQDHPIYISVSHGLRVDFCFALRDAIFLPDIQDKNRIEAWGSIQDPPVTFAYLMRTRPQWVLKRCKHIIPPPEQLYLPVEQVLRTYGPLKDAKTGLPLFNAAAWSSSQKVLEVIQKGFISDPPGIALYQELQPDVKAGGLPMYGCFRGTNFTEGSFHRHIIEHTPTHGVSVQHVHACLLDVVLVHNMCVGTYHSSGRPYQGHYSIWLTNELQEVCLTLHSYGVIQDNYKPPDGWVNSNFYQPTTERLGILPLPQSTCEASGMLLYNPKLHSSQTHWFIASLQNTQCPVLPIHNSAEETLFHQFMASHGGGTEPLWQNIVLAWNEIANNKKEISYKLNEHLRLYYTGDWKRSLNVKQTLALTLAERKEVKQNLTSTAHTKYLPAISQVPLVRHHVPQGLLELNNNELTNTASAQANDTSADAGGLQPPLLTPSNERSSSLSESESATPSLLPVSSSSCAGPIPAISSTETSHVSARVEVVTPSSLAASTSNTTLSALAVHRVENSTKRLPAIPKKKAPKKCPKCTGGEACAGRKAARLCTGVCRDCGRKECRGRNSKKIKLPCHLGWD
ncbi:hypothetical protein GYMLUDRAFT_253216 [Collybiopsis luxurians FD-317 M1]|uniref:Uncharacterized protein n=1 Tax=Collybiopsis luxurians FD-317 M1 TaxID=944289 RepID=A0A0D0AJ22_9AGAR|nr:hypothetical protein GYMLUDRAFT_253216 [Collybiopsis luxurians FD-317 M1]